jgi:VanZ family protein
VTEITPTASNSSTDSAARPGGPSLARWLAPLAMMAAIFYFSAQPFEGDPLEWWEVGIRKLGHVTGYALLTASFIWALTGRTSRPIATGAVLALAYACTDEFHQTFVENRSGTAMDIGIDAIGITIACVLGAFSVSRRTGAGSQRPGWGDQPA